MSFFIFLQLFSCYSVNNDTQHISAKYLLCQFPSTISNGLIEYSTKKEETRSLEPTSKSNKPYNQVTLEDLLYYIFWWCVYGMLTFLCMSWMDVLPYFGTSKSFAELHEKWVTNLINNYNKKYKSKPCSQTLLGLSTYMTRPSTKFFNLNSVYDLITVFIDWHSSTVVRQRS